MNARRHTVRRAWLLSAVAIVLLVGAPARAEEPADGTRAVVKLVRPVSAPELGPRESANATDAPSAIAAPVESDGALRPRTLADLEALALGNNPTLAQSRAQVGAAEGRYVQGGLYPNPSVGYMGSEIGNAGYGGQQGAYVGQRIITAKKLQLNRATIEQEIQQAEWAAQAQERRVLNDVRTAFYELLVARRAVEVQEQLLNIGQQGVKSAKSLQAAKEVSRVDFLQARVEVEAAAIDLQNAKNRYTAGSRKMAAIVGVPHLDASRLQGNLDEELKALTWDATLAQLLSESPELAQAQAGVERARWMLQRECAGRVPNIDTLASVQYDNSTRSTFGSLSIGVPLPVFDRNQGNIRRAQAELMAAENEVQRLELQLRNRLAAAFQRYENARQQVEKYSGNVLPTARESLDLVVVGYRQGEFPYLTLPTAQRTYFRFSLKYLESVRDLRASTVAIEGLMLSGGLGPEGGSVLEPGTESGGSTADAGVLRGIND